MLSPYYCSALKMKQSKQSGTSIRGVIGQCKLSVLCCDALLIYCSSILTFVSLSLIYTVAHKSKPQTFVHLFAKY